MLLSPVEYPYERSGAHPRLRDIVTKPLSHKKFMLTMLVVFLYTFGTNVPASALNYYLVNDVKVSYTLIQFLNLRHPVCMILLMRYWQRIIRRFGWLRTFAVSLLMTAPTVLAYSCVTAGNYLWLLTAVRLSQHVIMMGMNIAYSNMSFLNMPRADPRTNYIAFNTITANLAAFLGMMCGTWFVGRFPEPVRHAAGQAVRQRAGTDVVRGADAGGRGLPGLRQVQKHDARRQQRIRSSPWIAKTKSS